MLPFLEHARLAQQTHQVARHVVLETGVEIGHFRIDSRVGCEIESTVSAQVEVAAEGILQIRVLDAGDESGVDARGIDGAQLDRIELVVEFLGNVPGEAVVAGYDIAGIFGPVLVVVREIDVHLRQVDEWHAQDEIGIPRNLQAGGDTQFGRPCGRIEHKLEVAAEAQRKHFPAPEQILVAVGKGGCNAKKSRGVEGTFQVELDGLQAGLLKEDAAVHGSGIVV